MIRTLTILATMFALASPSWAIEYNQVDTSKSSIRFVATLMGSKTTGSFKKFTAQLRFDPDKVATMQARADIDMQSFDIGFDEANDEAFGANWFDIKRFPQATFAATQVQALGHDRFNLTGTLSIKGQSRVITFPVILTRDTANTASLDGQLTIKRLDFGLGQGAWAGTGTVANDVALQIHLVLNKK